MKRTQTMGKKMKQEKICSVILNRNTTFGGCMENKITIAENVLIGNFCQTDEDNKKLAEAYKKIIENEMTEYCDEEYPGYKIDIKITLQRALGSSRKVEIYESNENTVIINDLERQYEYIQNRIDIYRIELSDQGNCLGNWPKPCVEFGRSP